jgi:hypothetical protein
MIYLGSRLGELAFGSVQIGYAELVALLLGCRLPISDLKKKEKG